MDRRTVVSALVLVALIGTASAALFTFTQTFQQVNVSNAAISSNCNSLAAQPPGLVRDASPNASYILFTCAGPSKAFSVVSTSISATPTFTLSSGYRNASVVVFNPLATSCIGVNFITSGVPVTLVSNSYSYCVGYDITTLSTPLGSFSITWAWNQ